MIRNFAELESRLAILTKKPIVGLVCAQDGHSLEALKKGMDKNLIDSVLIGEKQEILRLTAAVGMERKEYTLVDLSGERECAREGVRLAGRREIDILMKGKIQTRDFLKAIVDSEKGIKQKGSLLSHIALIEQPGYPKLFAVTDGGMVTSPDLQDKKALLENAVEIFRNLGYEKPKAAVLTAVETVNPRMQETLDAEALKGMTWADCIVEGPISYDLAFSRESAEIKGYRSVVTGDVDILLMPDIASGNILCKALIYAAGARMAGIIAGAEIPIVLTSRGASASEKYNSLLLAAMCGGGTQ